MSDRRFYLSEEMAVEFMTKTIKEVWSKKPTMIRISLEGSIDELPMLHVEYDCYAYSIEVGTEY